MMHPHMAKLLADARIDEMLATAERHRLRQLARRQRHRATEEPTAESVRRRTPCDAISRLMGELPAKENPVGKISPQTTSKHLDLDGIEAHYGTLDAYTVGFEFSAHDEDPAPLFTGLPDNACQARHWGVVLEGTLVIRYTDNSEDVIEAGEAYYAPPGHLPLFKAGTRLIEFSPTEELDKTMAKVMVNVDAIQAG